MGLGQLLKKMFTKKNTPTRNTGGMDQLQDRVEPQWTGENALFQEPQDDILPPRTGPMTDEDVVSSTDASSGANTVTKMNYARNIGSSGTNVGYFKGEGGVLSQEAHDAGITPSVKGRADHSTRSVLSGRLDQLLGTNVVARDEYGEHNGTKGSVSPEVQGTKLTNTVFAPAPEMNDETYQMYEEMGMTGMMKKKGPDQYERLMGMDNLDTDLTNAKTQKGLSDLAVNDFLSGQVDRHQGNIAVANDGKVTGFDNDLAWGKDNKGLAWSKNHVGMPQHIDKTTGQNLLGIKSKQYKSFLKGEKDDTSHLSKGEQKAALSRFKAMKKHVKKLNKQGKLVDNWDQGTHDEQIAENLNGGDTTDKKLLNEPTHRYKSYLARAHGTLAQEGKRV